MAEKMSILQEQLDSNPSFRLDLDAARYHMLFEESVFEAYRLSGLTLAEVAERMSLPVAVVAKIFNGDSVISDLNMMIKLFLVLGFSPQLTAEKADNPDVRISTTRKTALQ